MASGTFGGRGEEIGWLERRHVDLSAAVDVAMHQGQRVTERVGPSRM